MESAKGEEAAHEPEATSKIFFVALEKCQRFLQVSTHIRIFIGCTKLCKTVLAVGNEAHKINYLEVFNVFFW